LADQGPSRVIECVQGSSALLRDCDFLAAVTIICSFATESQKRPMYYKKY